VGYDISKLSRVRLKKLNTRLISPLSRVKFKMLTTSRQASGTCGQNFKLHSREWRNIVKENLFLPLINTNFISKAVKRDKCEERHDIERKGLYVFLPLLRHFNPTEPVVEKSVIL
jgi:hypothetical protein